MIELESEFWETISIGIIVSLGVIALLDSFTASFKDNVKYVIDPNSKVTNVISEMSGLIPLQKR